ncbi:MAG: nucleotide disphospho-sugar-binding domain-containing protein, partial [Pseudomonadota bacterium]
SRFDYKLLQAPYHPPASAVSKRRMSLLYSDDLMPCGYYDPDILAGLIRSWSDLYEMIEPDMLIAQAAPTAVLAAREHKFKTIMFGGGYDTPAKASPMPPLRYWEKQDAEELKRREAEALDVINTALKKLKRPKLKNYAQALDVDLRFLTTFEELDHYPNREEIEGQKSEYLGGMFSVDKGERMSWNKGAKKRIFAYIRPDSGGFKPCIEALAKISNTSDIIIAAPGMPEAVRQQVEKPHIRIVNGSVNLSSILDECDLGICHASQGIAYAFAIHGVPQLLLPSHIEQFMCAKAVGRQKLGRGVVGKFGPDKIIELVKVLLQDPQYTQAAKAFAEKYKKFKPVKIADRLSDEILDLLKV